MRTWDLAIGAFNWQADADTFRADVSVARETGYLYAYAGMGCWQDEALERGNAVLVENGLTLFSAHGCTGIETWDFDVASAAGRMTDQIRRLNALNVHNITFHALVPGEDRLPSEEVARLKPELTNRFCELFGEVGRVAEAQSVSANIENIENWFDAAYVTAEQVLTIVERVKSGSVNTCLDSGHAHMSGLTPGSMIRKLGARLREVHFHDNFGRYDRHMPVGSGTINWMDVMSALAEIGYASPVTFEMGTADRDGERFADKSRSAHENWRRMERLAMTTG